MYAIYIRCRVCNYKTKTASGILYEVYGGRANMPPPATNIVISHVINAKQAESTKLYCDSSIYASEQNVCHRSRAATLCT